MLKSSDIYVLLGIAAHNGEKFTFRDLAARLDVPVPLVQRSLARLSRSGLYVESRRQAHLPNLEEFLVHALRYIAPATLGAVTPGIPAAWAAPPLAGRIVGDELPPVWASAHPKVRGVAIEPLHAAAVEAVDDDPRLGQLLALADCFRAGDLRVRREAEAALHELLGAKS